jgi:hypothetical protein
LTYTVICAIVFIVTKERAAMSRYVPHLTKVKLLCFACKGECGYMMPIIDEKGEERMIYAECITCGAKGYREFDKWVWQKTAEDERKMILP